MKIKLLGILLLASLAGCSSDAVDEMMGNPGPLCVPEGLPDPASGPVFAPIFIAESKVDPFYPERARIDRVGGEVILLVSVATDGTVCAIQVESVEPPGYQFETASIKAVEQWLYEPATQDGQPVAHQVTVFVEFVIQGPAGDPSAEPLLFQTVESRHQIAP